MRSFSNLKLLCKSFFFSFFTLMSVPIIGIRAIFSHRSYFAAYNTKKTPLKVKLSKSFNVGLASLVAVVFYCSCLSAASSILQK